MDGEKKILAFELLGSFTCKDAKQEPMKAGRKTLSFLQYLIINHGRNISSEELMEQFWGEKDSRDPANALKHMLFKTRRLLRSMFPEWENLLLTLQGCYAWNPKVQLELDTEQFEQYCLLAKRQKKEVRLETLLKAASLYKGEFLSGNDSDWVVSLRRYYQTLYLDVCKETLPILQKEERWQEIIRICDQASSVDFSTDIFVVCQMQALTALGHPEHAIEAYQRFRERLWQEFEIEPARHVEQAYLLAVSMQQNSVEYQDIIRMMTEEDTDGQAFFCTFHMFQSIVALEKRHLSRSRQISSLVVVSLGNKVTPTTDARRLERILLKGLRTGDPVARLDAGSYILMLTGASTENAQMVMERLIHTFHKAYSRSKACISFQVSPLKPSEASTAH